LKTSSSTTTYRRRINIALLAALALNAALWAGSRHVYAQWAGVPPVPGRNGAVVATLGDPQFAYRSGAMTLQTLGDGGGRVTSLRNYDYKRIGEWLDLLDSLDPASEHLPSVAAFYFGALRGNPEATMVMVDYLARVGNNPAGVKWRWLAQAAHLAQHRGNDLDRALDIAYVLSRLELTDGRVLPPFAREYPVFILREKGEKDAARKLMENLLLTEENHNEARFIRSFLIDQLGVPRAEVNALMRKRRDSVANDKDVAREESGK
jgi:hypothetical protein